MDFFSGEHSPSVDRLIYETVQYETVYMKLFNQIRFMKSTCQKGRCPHE